MSSHEETSNLSRNTNLPPSYECSVMYVCVYVWYGVVWYGMVWVVWCGTVRYGMFMRVCVCVV